MKIEKHYYQKAKQEIDKIEAEMQAEYEAMTDKELQNEKESNDITFNKLMDKIEHDYQRTKQVTDPEKEKYFMKLAAISLKLAKEIEADITVEINEKYGSITLTTGLILFGKPGGNFGKEDFVLLLRMANNVLIWPKDDTIEIILRYDLFDEIIAESSIHT